MEQLLEIVDDHIEADEEQSVVELSTELLGQIGGGGSVGTTI